VLLAAIVLGLTQAGLDPWLAAVIVAGVVLIIGAVVVSVGLKAIRESNLAPTQTAETVKENVEYIKEHVG
jgi:membrane protein